MKRDEHATNISAATACPCCSLLCDRTVIDAKCLRRDSLLSSAMSDAKRLPRIDGQEVTWEVARECSRVWLDAASFPLISGCIADVGTAREAVELARRYHAAIDLWDSDHAFAYFETVQRQGMITTTLNEIRERCDLLILVGDDQVLDQFPLLPMRTARREGNRRTLLLGNWSESARLQFEPAGEAWVIRSDLKNLPLQLLIRERIGGDARLLQSNELTAVLWSQVTPPVRNGLDIWLQRLHDWLLMQGRYRRTAALPLMDLTSSFSQACTWLTGFPGRVRFQDGNVRFDPYRYRAQSLCSADEIDLVVWYRSRDRDGSPSVCKMDPTKKQIVIDQGLDGEIPDSGIWMPSPSPGWDSPGTFFRADSGTICNALA